MDIQKLFEELYVKNAPSWSIERDPDSSYKYHATKSAFVLFENQQLEIESLKSELAKAQVPESNALLSASLDAIQKLGSGDFVLVPKELSENIAHQLAKSEFKKSETIFNSSYRDLSIDAKNDLKQKWIEQKTRCIVVDYKTLIGKAQEQSHE